MYAVGQQLGKYQIEALLGQGGMAAVYRARDVTTQRLVAIKVLHPALAWNEKAVQRSLLEAQTAARLRHPNIVTIYEVGEQGGVYFIVMELLDGEPLSVILSRGRLSPERALRILRQVAAALDYAHQQGVVHRDVKRANVFVMPGDHVKQLDFGIAKVAEVSGLTVSGGIVGSPAYMAPEQARGEPVGPAADIYALGVLAYEMLTGRPPFTGATVHVLHAHAYATPPPARRWNPQLPAAVERALARVLAKHPQQRYPSALAFVRALEKAMRGRVPLSRQVPGQFPWMWAGISVGALVILFAIGALVMAVSCPFCPPSPTLLRPKVGVTASSSPGFETVLKGMEFVALREGPSGGLPILAWYVPGTRVRVVGRNSEGSWLVVQGPGDVQSWVFVGYVNTRGIEISTLPVYPTPRAKKPLSTLNLTPSVSMTLTPAGRVAHAAFVNLRTGPGVGYAVITPYPEGTLLTLLGRDADARWLRVRTSDGHEGGMHGRYIDTGGVDPRSLPVIPTPTLPLPTVLYTPTYASPTPSPIPTPVFTTPTPKPTTPPLPPTPTSTPVLPTPTPLSTPTPVPPMPTPPPTSTPTPRVPPIPTPGPSTPTPVSPLPTPTPSTM